MAAAAGAAEVPVLTYLAIGLLALLAWLVSRGLHSVWIHTFGAIFHAVGSVGFGGIGGIGSVHPLHFLIDFSNGVANTFLLIAQKSEHAMGYFFHGAAVIQGWIARELVGLARDTLAWATWLQHSHLPRWVRAIAYATVNPAILARLIAHQIALHAPSLTRTITYRVKLDRAQLRRLVAAAVAGAIGATLPGISILPRLRKIEHETITTLARLKKIGWVGAYAGPLALVAVGLRKLGLSWVRCEKVGKVGKAVCGANAKWLEKFLLGMVAIFGTISLRTFSVEVYALMGEAVKEVGHFWQADLGHTPPNPGLGEIGGPAVAFRPKGYVRPSPGLGDVA